MTNDRKYALFQKGYRPSRVHATKNGQTENPLPRCVHASLHEGLSVCPSEYPSITPVQKKKKKYKAGYTATPVACKWARAVI